MGWFDDFIFGKKEKNERKDLLSPEAREKLSNYMNNPIEKSPLYGAGGDYLQRLLSNDPEAYKDFERPYLENFEQNIAPGIAQRYAGMGTGASGLSTSGFQSSLAQAGRGLQTDLASQRGKMQMQSLPEALRYAQQPYENDIRGVTADQNSYQNTRRPGTNGIFQPLVSGLVTAGATAFGGPAAGAVANTLSNAVFNQGKPGQ